MVHSVSGWTRCMLVKLRFLENAWHTWRLRWGVITARRYTDTRLPYLVHWNWKARSGLPISVTLLHYITLHRNYLKSPMVKKTAKRLSDVSTGGKCQWLSAGNDRSNKYDLRCDGKTARDGAEVTETGRVFQKRLPITGKARSPTVLVPMVQHRSRAMYSIGYARSRERTVWNFITGMTERNSHDEQ